MSGEAERLGATVRFELAEVLAATGGELASLGTTTTLRGVTTDSRAVGPGELFVALRGETHDAHRYVAAALEQGAGAVVVERGALDGPVRPGTIVVRDTLEALGALGAFHRRRARARVVAITGSNGKTTTKELLAAVLAHALGPDAVLHTRGTQNNLIGVPLTLLRIADEAVAVVECGMNGPGEIWRLVAITQPDVGVVTCVAAAHLEGLGSIEGVADAKGEMYRQLRPAALAIYNADDPRVASRALASASRPLGFGTHDGADVRATAIDDRGLEGVTFRLSHAGRAATVRLALPGRHNVTNALAAAAAALGLGLDLDVVAAGLSTARGPAMRMEVHRLASGVTIVNDAYNANPASMAAALATLAATPATRRVAVLGEMRELGADAEAAHHALGIAAAAARVDMLFLLGARADAMTRGATEAGLPRARIVVAIDHEALGAALVDYCRPGDVVLVKGSRGSAMERAMGPLLSAESR